MVIVVADLRAAFIIKARECGYGGVFTGVRAKYCLQEFNR